MRVVAIIQARLGSTRLPGKMLLPLAGKPLLEQVMERVTRSTRVHDVVLAIPAHDQALQDMADQHLCSYFTYRDPGDESDLVGRYVRAANWVADIRQTPTDLIVRIPGDNPCIEPWLIDETIRHYLDEPVTFYTTTTCLVTPPDQRDQKGDYWVDGIGCEIFSYSRLRWLNEKTKGQPEYREHPHKYFYDKGIVLDHPADVRLDVNTQAEYDSIKDIYDTLYPVNPQFGVQEVLAYLHTKEMTHA